MATYARALAARRGQTGSCRGPRAAARRAWLTFVAAIMVCFCWQTSVTQTHIHLAPPAPIGAAAGAARAAAALPRGPAQPDTPSSCPICRDMLHAGHFLPGTPPAVPALPSAAPIALPGSANRAGTVPQWSHAWYGRGPPVSILVP